MALEIEKKFLVINDDWKDNILSEKHIVQQYISIGEMHELRVRIVDDILGVVTTKIKTDNPTVRNEYEGIVDIDTARKLVETGSSSYKTIYKTRYVVKIVNDYWEVDVYSGDNEGLVTAELELDDENQSFNKPSFVGEDITDDKKYKNKNLAIKPYQQWL